MLTNLTIVLALLLTVAACSTTDKTTIEQNAQYNFMQHKVKSKHERH